MKHIRATLLILSVIGVAVMGYLTALHYGTGSSAFCDINNAASCSTVNKSPYAEVAGIPLGIIGILTFIFFFLLALQQQYRMLLFAGIVALIPSLYFTGIEIAVIKSICIFCELAKLLMIAIIILTSYALKKESPHFPVRETLIAIFLGIVGAIATAFLQGVF